MTAAARSQEFVHFALQQGVLRFGEFRVKSGRISPYFFNAGLFCTGASLGRLADFYAHRLLDSGLGFDMLFGPAYKGIPLASATAVALSRLQPSGADIPYAFNRKEAKLHGEGGEVVGAPLQGRVVIIDDVITAGTSVGESVALIRAAGAVPAGVLIALDRMEIATSTDAASRQSAVQEVQQRYGMPVMSIASLDDILSVLDGAPDLAQHQEAVRTYRERYGI